MTNAKNGFTIFENQTFDDLLYMDALRGMDSTGVVSFLNTGEVQLIKSPWDFSSMKWYVSSGSKEYDSILKDSYTKGRALLGHNRKATIGKADADNAHPFNVDNRYFFMHNGTLRQHEKLAGGNKFVVDSEALANHICKHVGDKEALEKALSEVDGAYACQWVDQQTETLHLIRNTERPLHIAELKTGGFIWASEPGFIIAAVHRNKLVLKDGIKEIPAHTLYSISLSDDVDLVTEELTVKKHIPLTTGKVVGGTIPTTISNKYFKHLRHKYLNKSAMCWIDNFYDEGESMLLRGSNENLLGKLPHEFRFWKPNMTISEAFNEYDGQLVRGVVREMELEPGKLVLYLASVEKVKMVH